MTTTLSKTMLQRHNAPQETKTTTKSTTTKTATTTTTTTVSTTYEVLYSEALWREKA